MKLAITGGTGFVGSHLIDLALAEGHPVRALTRRAQPPRDGLNWIEGTLASPDRLAALVEGCDAVIHVAGVVNGSEAEFHNGNVVGTEHMVAAAKAAGIRRLVHISSLSAREPQLSAYGRSKLASEAPVKASGLDWTILRPPAIYGPRERDLLELFRFARRGLVPLPPGGRVSMIAAEDLCRLILACLGDAASFGQTYEPDDGREGGWSTIELARAIGEAVGRRVLPLPIPQALLRVGVRIDQLLRGKKARLTADRVGYMCHPDWTAHPHAHPPRALWTPRIETRAGLAATARWYRAAGWL